MNLPVDQEILWLVLVFALVFIIGLAVWLGRGVKVRSDEKGLSLEVSPKSSEASPIQRSVDVLSNTEIQDSSLGNVTGVDLKGQSAASEVPETIKVLKEAKIKNLQTGDITGAKVEGSPEKKDS